MKGSGKPHLEKNPIQKTEKIKNQNEFATCEQKTTSEKESELLFKHRFLTLL